MQVQLKDVLNVTVWPKYISSSLLHLLTHTPISDFLVALYLIRILISYLPVIFYSKLPRNPDIPSRFSKGWLFNISIKPVVFKIFLCWLNFFQVIGPIALSDYWQVIDICSYNFQSMENFYFCLEICVGVTDHHW